MVILNYVRAPGYFDQCPWQFATGRPRSAYLRRARTELWVYGRQETPSLLFDLILYLLCTLGNNHLVDFHVRTHVHTLSPAVDAGSRNGKTMLSRDHVGVLTGLIAKPAENFLNNGKCTTGERRNRLSCSHGWGCARTANLSS